MSATGWMHRDLFPVICGCCGNLVISCWERGHDKACDNCRDHFWRNGPEGDKPCDGRNLAKGLNGKNGDPYEKAVELKLRHAHGCKWMRTPRGEFEGKDRSETDQWCECGYIAARREREQAGEIGGQR